MAKVRRILLALLLAVLFAVGLFVGVQVAPLFRPDPAARIHNTPAILKQVQTLSQLVTVQYVIEKAVVWEDPPQGIFGQAIGGNNRVLLLANGIVKAGVDLSRMTSNDLEIQGNKIIIRLPNARITDAYLDDTQTQVIERTTGFLRSFDKDLEQNVRQRAVEDIHRAARKGGILQDADTRAREQLAGLLLQLGFAEVEFRAPDSSPLNRIMTTPAETSGTQER